MRFNNTPVTPVAYGFDTSNAIFTPSGLEAAEDTRLAITRIIVCVSTEETIVLLQDSVELLRFFLPAKSNGGVDFADNPIWLAKNTAFRLQKVNSASTPLSYRIDYERVAGGN